MSERQALLGSAVSLAHLSGVTLTPPPAAPAAAAPAPARIDDGEDDDMKAKKPSKKAKKAKKAADDDDEEDDGGDDPDEDDDDGDDADMSRARERVRIRAILTSPAAAKNFPLAVHLATSTAMPSAQAIDCLAASLVAAAAPARGRLEASMAAAAIPPVPANAPAGALRPSERALAAARSTNRQA